MSASFYPEILEVIEPGISLSVTEKDDGPGGLKILLQDYITKPFNMQELQARLQAMLRRARQPAFTQASSARRRQHHHRLPWCWTTPAIPPR